MLTINFLPELSLGRGNARAIMRLENIMAALTDDFSGDV